MKLICIGDSNTWGYDPRSFWGERYSGQYRWTDVLAVKIGAAVINAGENGRKTTDYLNIPSADADCIMVMLGTNDILEGRSALETGIGMEKLLKLLTQKSKKILLVAPPALRMGAWVSDSDQVSQSLMLGQEYASLARTMELSFVNAVSWEIPLCYDGVHFSEEGHLRFAEKMSKEIDKII